MENSHDTATDPATDWRHVLPREIFREVVRVLRGALPSPADGSTKDEGQQDRAAMAAVGALKPANAEEGQLAAHFVMAEAWAADCLRLAEERRLEINLAMRCRAQALSFMREAKSVRRLLAKVQADRRKMEKDAEARSRAEWEEHAVLGMMAEGLAEEEADAGAVDAGSSDVGKDVAAESVSEFGFGLFGENNSCGAGSETGARLRKLSRLASGFT